jgi:glycosyltransferase 2 family protein
LMEAVQGYAPWHGALVNVLLGSIGVQVLRIVQAYYLGVGLGIQAPISVYFAFIPMILLIMLLPITINGLGTSQYAFIAFFSRAGVTNADAFALSVLFVALGFIGNLPGGLLFLNRGLPIPERDRSDLKAVR